MAPSFDDPRAAPPCNRPPTSAMGDDDDDLDPTISTPTVESLERAIRAQRKSSTNGGGSFRYPCRNLSRGPTVGELLVYYDEKNRALREVRSRRMPPSAFNAGHADNGEGDITDAPACYRPGAGSGGAHAALARDPELLRRVIERTAARLGVAPDHRQRVLDAGAAPKASEPIAPATTPKLPDAIARGNAAKCCRYCGHPGTRYRCSRCKAVSYCSQACQKRHWREGHANACTPIEHVVTAVTATHTTP